MTTLKPIILINFKKTNGAKAIMIAKELEKIHDSLVDKYEILLAIQPQDILYFTALSQKYKIVLQDTFSSDQYDLLTYYFEHYTVADDKIFGILLNHPEKKMNEDTIRDCVIQSNKFGLKILMCSTTLEEGVMLNKYGPSFICVESENLIGKPGSFLQHCPEIVKDAKAKINSKILIGAGIKSKGDLQHVLNDGGSGVLISSIIMNAVDPKAALEMFLEEN